MLDANPALAQMDPGGIVEGVVTGRDARGQVVLDTAFGQIAFASRLNLPVGAKVILEIQSTGARLTAIVLSVNGHPATAASQAAILPLPDLGSEASTPPHSAPGPQPQPGPAAPEPVAEITLTTGQVTTATIVQPARAAPPLPPSASAGIPSAPSPAAPMANAAMPGNAETLVAPAVSSDAAGTAALSPAPPLPAAFIAQPLPQGTRFAVRVLAIDPNGGQIAAPQSPAMETPAAPAPGPAAAQLPDEPAPPALPLSAGAIDRLPGLVIGREGGGEIAIRTQLGMIELTLPSTPPAGSTILLELIGVPQLPSSPPNAAAATEDSAIPLAQEWPALGAALSGISSETAGAASSPALDLPHAGLQLALGLLRFAAALELGSLDAWLAPAALQQLAGHDIATASRLSEDFARLAQLASEHSPGDWRSFFIPVHDGHRLLQLRLFLKRQDGQPGREPGAPGPAGQRFVIELELSRLGPLQLDAFMRGRRLNLVLRSHYPLARELRGELEEIFAAANEASGLAGSLGFQDSLGRFPLAPLESLRHRTEGVVV